MNSLFKMTISFLLGAILIILFFFFGIRQEYYFDSKGINADELKIKYLRIAHGSRSVGYINGSEIGCGKKYDLIISNNGSTIVNNLYKLRQSGINTRKNKAGDMIIKDGLNYNLESARDGKKQLIYFDEKKSCYGVTSFSSLYGENTDDWFDEGIAKRSLFRSGGYEYLSSSRYFTGNYLVVAKKSLLKNIILSTGDLMGIDPNYKGFQGMTLPYYFLGISNIHALKLISNSSGFSRNMEINTIKLEPGKKPNGQTISGTLIENILKLDSDTKFQIGRSMDVTLETLKYQ